jgi:hypothetical protein
MYDRSEEGADVVFADVHSVRRTLHAYAEMPICIRGREIALFRKNTGMNREVSGADRDTQNEEDNPGGAICVSNFPPNMKQEELLEAFEPFGKYKKVVMRMPFAFLPPSLSF